MILSFANFPNLLERKLNRLHVEVIGQEIKSVIFNMRVLTALGKNGLNALFFQS